MIFPHDPLIYVAKTSVDLRWGVDKLAATVVEHFGKQPRDGAWFVFLNRPRSRLKILFFDAAGPWLLHRRLDRGTFPLPVTLDARATHIAISAEELKLLLQGLETGRTRRLPRPPPMH